MQYGPKGTPIHRPKGVKTKVSPLKRKIAYMDLLSVLCGVSKHSISIYFSNANLELSNPRAIRKRLEERYEKYGCLDGHKKKIKTSYKREKKEQPIQGPSIPNDYKPRK